MTNDTSTEKISILQWNIYGLKPKLPTLSLALAEERYGIVLLQETLLKSDISLSNYTAYHQYQSQGNRGLSILVRKDLYVERLPFRRFCGTEVEAMGVTVSLKNTTLQIYNIYRPPRATATLKLDHIFAAVSKSPSILCGDFNAHSPTWNCPSSPSALSKQDAPRSSTLISPKQTYTHTSQRGSPRPLLCIHRPPPNSQLGSLPLSNL